MDSQVIADPQDLELRLLLDAIYHVYHYDFRAYSEASLKRRVQTALLRFKLDTVSRLQERILRDPKMFAELLQFLTVPVSDMFRDPPYFKALRETVVPYLGTYAAIKVWVAGCSTGEEAYSIAILLDEAGLLERSLIYATDINPDSLRAASEGVYELSRFTRFSENYVASGGTSTLSNYYAAAYGNALMDRRLRRRSCSPITASRPTACSPRCSSPRAATCSSTSRRNCRSGRSVCSPTRSAARDTWASGSRRRCGSRVMPPPSPNACRKHASTGSYERPGL
jgi:chemotaxis protein methyltransferase CheR